MFLTIEEIASMAGRSSVTIRRWIDTGRMPRASHRRKRTLLWDRATVETALAAMSAPVAID